MEKMNLPALHDKIAEKYMKGETEDEEISMCSGVMYLYERSDCLKPGRGAECGDGNDRTERSDDVHGL